MRRLVLTSSLACSILSLTLGEWLLLARLAARLGSLRYDLSLRVTCGQRSDYRHLPAQRILTQSFLSSRPGVGVGLPAPVLLVALDIELVALEVEADAFLAAAAAFALARFAAVEALVLLAG